MNDGEEETKTTKKQKEKDPSSPLQTQRQMMNCKRKQTSNEQIASKS